MASKNVALPYQTISSVSVSATTVVTSSVTSLQYLDAVAIQFIASDQAQGILDVQGSLNYKTGLPQGTGQANSGTWVSIVQASPNALPVTISTASTAILVNMSQISFPWIRLQYTNSTASGTINAYISAKSWSA